MRRRAAPSARTAAGSLLCCLLGAAPGCTRAVNSDGVDPDGDIDLPPRWYVDSVSLPREVDGRVFNAMFAYPDGNLFLVGQYGVILTNRAPEGTVNTDGDPIEGFATNTWRVMPSPTQAHLTAITGVRNGADYGYGPTYGEMFAVGWEGTVIHFNPDPDDDPQTLDGVWELISGPEGAGLLPTVRVDPACPDADGDGVPDDGDQTGFWGDLLCSPPTTAAACDDNCRETPNGTLRPLIDRQTCAQNANECNCFGPGDSADPTQSQIDVDGDGRGQRCDPDDGQPDGAEPAPRFTGPLFGLEVVRNPADGLLRVIAVGGDGAIVTFQGPAVASAGTPPAPPALDVRDAASWRAQLQLPFYFDDDCPGQGVPRGDVCPGVATRLPPSCAGQCNPLHRACGANCPVAEAPCCDPAASTGAGCSDGSCGPAPNACNNIQLGQCETLCADCFRRLDDTLRAVISDSGGGCTTCGVLAVGSDGRIVAGDPNNPTNSWTGVTCDIPPAPIDEATLTAVDAVDDRYVAVGSAGSIFFIDPAGGRGGCQERDVGQGVTGGVRVESKLGAPGVFLRDVYAVNATFAYAVGDEGTFLEVRPDTLTSIETHTHESLFAITSTYDAVTGNPIYWLAGADGTLLRAEFR